LRELFLNAHIVHSHLLHFFALAAPDFVPGAGAENSQRNLLGLVGEVGLELGRKILVNRGYAQKIQGIVAGHPIHPVAALPGGMARAISEDERVEIEGMAKSLTGFAMEALSIFETKLLAAPDIRDAIEGDTYFHRTHYAGLVDEDGRVNFYDGRVRVVDPQGREVAVFEGADYLDHIAERVVPWSYLKIPYLKKVGWRGLTEGEKSGVYRVNSLARLNVAEGMATPMAQAAYERLYDHFGQKPVHHTLAYHWARLIECLYCAETTLRLAHDPEIASPDIRAIPTKAPSSGVGVVEAARGTLYHHYVTDSRGMIKSVNLIVATVQNNAAMNMSVKKAAEKLICEGTVSDEILDRVEMAFRAYDPCLACATHALTGHMPLEVNLWQGGRRVRRLARENS
jgi:F420-non-reducing hydrogenase large subunit